MGKLTESERKELLAYQAKHKYDTMTQTTVGSNGTLSTTALGNTQGFTYYAMKRLGWEKKKYGSNNPIPVYDQKL